tara:strand:+ start:412 stop:1020 length:609 start_codon:yes stop_codon:yes gene_type:complete
MFVNYDFLTSKIITHELFLTFLVAFLLSFAVYAEEEKVVHLIADENINKYLDKVSEIEMTRGPHDEAIVENLVSLSKIYKDQGEHIKRLEILKQALHIHRINNGLESRDQLLIVEEIISANTTLKSWMALDENYEYYYWVNRRVHGTNSLDLLPALNRFMEWKLDVLKRGLFGHPAIINHQATELLRKIRKIRSLNNIEDSK